MDEVIANLTRDLPAWWGTVKVLSYFGGFVLALVGLVRLGTAPRGGVGGGGLAAGLSALIAGVLLLNLMPLLDVVAQSLMEGDSRQELSYQPQAAGVTGTWIKFAVYVVMLAGLVAVARGLFLAAAVGGGRGSPQALPAAIAFIVGGVIAVNVVEFVQLLGASAGGTVETTIESLL